MRAAHRTQRNILLTRQLVYCKRIIQEQPDGRGAQGKVCGKRRGVSRPSLSGSESPPVHPSGSSPNPVLLGFMEASFHRQSWLNHWPFVMELNLQPLSPPQSQRWDWSFQPSLIKWLAPPATRLSESQLIKITMEVESVIQSEVSQKEKNKYSMLTHIYGI